MKMKFIRITTLICIMLFASSLAQWEDAFPDDYPAFEEADQPIYSNNDDNDNNNNKDNYEAAAGPVRALDDIEDGDSVKTLSQDVPSSQEDEEEIGIFGFCASCSCTLDLVCRFRCPLRCAAFGRGFPGQFCVVCSCLNLECNLRCAQCSGVGPTLFTEDQDGNDGEQ